MDATARDQAAVGATADARRTATVTTRPADADRRLLTPQRALTLQHGGSRPNARRRYAASLNVDATARGCALTIR